MMKRQTIQGRCVLTVLVSVIVPVYNAEKTLERCLRSLQRQTWRDLEVIAVNDGSTDGSLKIIRKYCAMDPRFRCVDKGNTGVSDSRNRGMALAAGEYLQFVDSDDWIPSNSTQLMVEAVTRNRADMAIGDYIRVSPSSTAEKGHIPREGRITRAEYAAYMMQAPANFYYGVMWNKLYRADVVRDNGLRCSDELSWCEDFRFNLEYLRCIQSVAVLFQPVYFYVKRKGSLVDTQVDLANTVRTKKALFQDYKELYDDLDMYEEHKLRIQAFYLEFARDGPRRPARPGRGPGKKALKLKPFKKERSNDPERFEAGLPGLGHLFGLSGDRRGGALLADAGAAVGGAGVGAGGGAADGPGDAGPGADPGD